MQEIIRESAQFFPFPAVDMEIFIVSARIGMQGPN